MALSTTPKATQKQSPHHLSQEEMKANPITLATTPKTERIPIKTSRENTPRPESGRGGKPVDSNVNPILPIANVRILDSAAPPSFGKLTTSTPKAQKMHRSHVKSCEASPVTEVAPIHLLKSTNKPNASKHGFLYEISDNNIYNKPEETSPTAVNRAAMASPWTTPKMGEYTPKTDVIRPSPFFDKSRRCKTISKTPQKKSGKPKERTHLPKTPTSPGAEKGTSPTLARTTPKPIGSVEKRSPIKDNTTHEVELGPKVGNINMTPSPLMPTQGRPVSAMRTVNCVAGGQVTLEKAASAAHTPKSSHSMLSSMPKHVTKMSEMVLRSPVKQITIVRNGEYL